MHIAMYKHDLPLILKLLVKGASLIPRNNRMKTPIEIVPNIEKREEVISFLLENKDKLPRPEELLV